jgi:hypothetical protein
MQNRNVPKATLQRYPVYLKALRKLQKNGVERIMSKELSSFVDIEPTTIRRDFSFLGNLGKQGYGYDVDKLIEIFNSQLGVDFDEKIITAVPSCFITRMYALNWNLTHSTRHCLLNFSSPTPQVLSIQTYIIPFHPLGLSSKCLFRTTSISASLFLMNL